MSASDPAADPISAKAVFTESRAVGCAGEVLESCPSTMAVARERFGGGVPDGYTVLAEHQSAGRGREGAWECPPGRGILMSILLLRGIPSRERHVLSVMGAVAAAEAVRRLGVPAQIKWPNDIVIVAANAPRLVVRKLGGILVDAIDRGDSAPAHILGFGLNVNQQADELPPGAALEPTSMRLVRGRPFGRANVLRAVLDELDVWYRRLAMGRPEEILSRWRTLSCLLGHEVEARVEGTVLRGTVAGIRATGELILKDASGRRHMLSEDRTHLVL